MKESEIRPKAIFDEYLRLAKIDTKTYFMNSVREEIHCPACNSIGKLEFRKDNFDYCKLLYTICRSSSKSRITY